MSGARSHPECLTAGTHLTSLLGLTHLASSISPQRLCTKSEPQVPSGSERSSSLVGHGRAQASGRMPLVGFDGRDSGAGEEAQAAAAAGREELLAPSGGLRRMRCEAEGWHVGQGIRQNSRRLGASLGGQGCVRGWVTLLGMAGGGCQTFMASMYAGGPRSDQSRGQGPKGSAIPGINT